MKMEREKTKQWMMFRNGRSGKEEDTGRESSKQTGAWAQCGLD